MKLDHLFCIVLVCSEPQHVFKYMEYLKSLFYYHILKCYSNKINETILTNFKNATVTSLYIFQNTVECKIPLL